MPSEEVLSILFLKLNFVDSVDVVSFAMRQLKRHLHELRRLFRNIFLPVKLIISMRDFDVIPASFGMLEESLLRLLYQYVAFKNRVREHWVHRGSVLVVISDLTFGLLIQ